MSDTIKAISDLINDPCPKQCDHDGALYGSACAECTHIAECIYTAHIKPLKDELSRYKATVACMQLSGGVERTFIDAVTGALAAGPGDELTDKLMQDAAMHFGHRNVVNVVRDVLGKLGKAEADREVLAPLAYLALRNAGIDIADATIDKITIAARIAMARVKDAYDQL